MKHRSLARFVPALAALAGALTAPPADGACMPAPTRVVTVTVTSCQVSTEHWQESGAGAEQPDFYREQVERTIEGYPGVVVTGTLEHAVEVESTPRGFTVLGVPETPDAGREGEWFVALPEETMADDPCAHYGDGEIVEIYSPPTCCDMLPPQDAACALGVEPGAPVPEALRALLGDPPAAGS